MANLNDPVVQELLQGRHIATLGTENADGAIHLTAVWFLFDGGSFYVATSSRSHKARNVMARPKASLMIDSRDPAASRGVTVIGTVEVLSGESSRQRNLEVHRRYLSNEALADARIGPVFAAWDDVTLKLTPSSMFAWDMREADRLAFGGAFAENPAYLLAPDR